MPSRVPTISITVIRDGKRITPTPNAKAFDFTADEIKQITAQHPAAFRKPINETAAVADGETAPEKTVKPTAGKANKKPVAKAPAKGGTPEIAADDADDAADEVGDDTTGGEDDDI